MATCVWMRDKDLKGVPAHRECCLWQHPGSALAKLKPISKLPRAKEARHLSHGADIVWNGSSVPFVGMWLEGDGRRRSISVQKWTSNNASGRLILDAHFLFAARAPEKRGSKPAKWHVLATVSCSLASIVSTF